jgi:hypothetical protein
MMGSNIHKHVMVKSPLDTIELGMAVETRFLDLCQSWLRIKQEQIPIPESINKDMMLWRAMRVRHKQGDHRNSEAEEKATKSIAQWTVDMNNILRNQPQAVVQWKDG